MAKSRSHATHPRLIFVADGPGNPENDQLLDRMIEAMGVTRSDVSICDVASLEQQIHKFSPDIIIALGEATAQTLLRNPTPISSLRGNFHKYREILLMPTWHPADLLRNPASKKEAWDDLKKVLAQLNQSR